MRLRTFSAGVVVLCMLLVFGHAQARSDEVHGAFVLYLGGVEAGREDYISSTTELSTAGTITIGGQSLKIESLLSGVDGRWTQYNGKLTPGASFTAFFHADRVEVEAGPLKRNYPLQEPFVILDNNVFAHYEQVLERLPEGQDAVTLSIVVPSLVLANQDVVLQGELVRMGEVVYQLEDGELLPLEEYLLTVAGTLQVRLLGRDKKLILMAIPAQLIEVVREGFIGLQPLAE